ncbi:MAG: D-tyrosyl-tRNA(Tyr) deacylase [Oceanospirillaceae bacterium]|nr:D-tyrosyl-tRNA(Tyr) deacylase [Oceanospirillaceae bacterium]
MKALIQRVSTAQVTVEEQTIGAIDQGIVLLLGVEKDDSSTTIERCLKKILNYRIFSDDKGKMNLSLKDIDAGLLIISQFTLVAQTNKGTRPGFSQGASPAHGEKIYDAFIASARNSHSKVACGQFGADMQVSLINDGPVTFMFEFSD